MSTVAQNGVIRKMTTKEKTLFNSITSGHKKMTDDERKMFFLRKRRNLLLLETDWTANSDVTMSDEMKTYRQQLRDLPANYTTTDGKNLENDLSNLNIPVKPKGNK